jgi:hypothetical protein
MLYHAPWGSFLLSPPFPLTFKKKKKNKKNKKHLLS